MRGELKLFRIFGVDVKLHASWWFVVILLAWVLSTGFFPQFYPNNSTQFYWASGIAAALFLFLSVLIHEFSHALVAKTQNMKVESITLFFFGGVAGITDEDISPKSEFLMAIAGPLMSFALAALFYAIFFATHQTNVFLNAISFYLYQLNFILAVFNLIPGYPLDGGRAFRALLHAHYRDLKKATLIASKGGKAFAIVLIILGALQIILAGSFGGLWLIFLGVFLHFIANLSYQQVAFKEVLGKWTAKQFATTKFQKIQSSENLKSFLDQYIGDRDTAFVVQNKTKTVGMTEIHKLDGMKPEVTSQMTVGQVTQPISQLQTVDENESAFAAFQKLLSADSVFLPVVKQSKKSQTITAVIRKENLMNALVWNLKFKANFQSTKQTTTKKQSKRTTKQKNAKSASSKKKSSSKQRKKSKRSHSKSR